MIFLSVGFLVICFSTDERVQSFCCSVRRLIIMSPSSSVSVRSEHYMTGGTSHTQSLCSPQYGHPLTLPLSPGHPQLPKPAYPLHPPPSIQTRIIPWITLHAAAIQAKHRRVFRENAAGTAPHKFRLLSIVPKLLLFAIDHFCHLLQE